MKWRAFLPAACAVMVLCSCDFTQDKDAAAAYAERYFAAATLEDVAAVLPLYSPRFFSVTPRETWLDTLQHLRDRCGTPTAHTLANWVVTHNVGTNAGTTVRLIYDVRRERCRTTETLVIFRPPDGGFSIIGHFFQMNGPAPAGSEKTTTT
ncbi:MAG: hypothetical protein ACLPQ6_00240 [Steroidobacteraceae bacterium]|jgi:hypothetical protein